MVGIVFRDYRMHWKEGIQSVFKNGSWFIYLYLMIVPVNLFDYADKISEVMTYYGILFPIMIGLLLSRMYSNGINKTMFLCPLEKEERKRYLVSAYWLRVIVPTFLFILIGTVLVGTHNISMKSFLILVVSETMYFIASNLYLEAAYQKPDYEKKHNLSGYTFWQIVAQIFGLFFMVVCISFAGDLNVPFQSMNFAIIFFLLVVQFAITIKVVLGYWEKVMRIAIDYEMSLVGSGKEE